MLKFSNLGKIMEAANHSKNSVMEAENHVKHRAGSMRRGNFFRKAYFALVVVGIIFSSCKDGGDNGNENENSLQSWTEIGTPFSGAGGAEQISAIASGNDLFVAASSRGQIAYSSNAKNWTVVSGNPWGNNSLYSASFGNNKFVVAGDGARMMYSSNGITWDAFTNDIFIVGGSHYTINSIVWGKNRFVAAGYDKISYSNNGENWIEGTFSPNLFPNIMCFGFGNGRLIAGGPDGKMAYSDDDAETWHSISNSGFGSYSIDCIAWGNGTFVAVGGAGIISCSSDNGVNWERVLDSKFGSNPIYSVTWGGGTFVAVGSRGRISYSTDGKTWQEVTQRLFNDRDIYTVCYSNGIFVVGGADQNIAYCTVK